MANQREGNKFEQQKKKKKYFEGSPLKTTARGGPFGENQKHNESRRVLARLEVNRRTIRAKTKKRSTNIHFSKNVVISA